MYYSTLVTTEGKKGEMQMGSNWWFTFVNVTSVLKIINHHVIILSSLALTCPYEFEWLNVLIVKKILLQTKNLKYQMLAHI